MGRKKKNFIRSVATGDSKSWLGLITLAVGTLTLFSVFLEAPVFTYVKTIFSDDLTNIFFSICMFNITLRLFKVRLPFTQIKSLVGQLVFIVFYAAFLNSIWGYNYQIIADQPVKYGGLVGFYVYNFFADTIFMQYTPIFLCFVIFLSIPPMLSISVTRFLEVIGSVMEKVFNFFKRIFGGKKNFEIEAPATTFGQLQRRGSVEVIARASEDEKEQEKTVSQMSQKNDMIARIARQPIITEKDGEGAYINEMLKYPNWKFPPVALLNSYKLKKHSQDNIKKNADIIEDTLTSFGIRAKVEDVLIGPSVTQYALDIALGTKVSKITNLINNLALALATQSNSIRLETPIPGTTYIGIEVPNADRETVYLKDAMTELVKTGGKYLLPLSVGKDIHGDLIQIDLQKMPHVLIAGSTGSGKSILTNGFIVSLLMTKTPDEVKFIMIDPKQVELSDYNGISHLLTPVITDMDKVVNSLKWAIAEMENRYNVFRESKVKNIEGYNILMGYAALPYIVIVVDEIADMMMSTNRVETENAIVRLAQKARATGIHLILATQRPSVDVITGLIKANIPGRIAMSVITNIDSRVILDQIGAESLLGRGDMLFKDPSKNRPFRIQGIWVSPEEVQRIVAFIKEQSPEVEYSTKVTEYKVKEEAKETGKESGSNDELFENAIKVIVNAQKGSASYLQRKLGVGYNRAAKLLEELEELGVVGPANGSKPRDVMISDADAFIASLSGPPPVETNPEEELKLENPS